MVPASTSKSNCANVFDTFCGTVSWTLCVVRFRWLSAAPRVTQKTKKGENCLSLSEANSMTNCASSQKLLVCAWSNHRETPNITSVASPSPLSSKLPSIPYDNSQQPSQPRPSHATCGARSVGDGDLSTPPLAALDT
eukprot:4035603-Amphidinium_carterae.1